MATTKPKRRIYEGNVHVCAHRVSFWFELPPRVRISEEDKARLTEEAEERAKSQIIEGYVEGELNYERDLGENCNRWLQARGWWRIERN